VHVLTHKDLHLHPVQAVLPAEWAGGEGAWFGAGEWPGLGLPAPVRRLLEAADS
jgi:A/G-specific adenine glycosylase